MRMTMKALQISALSLLFAASALAQDVTKEVTGQAAIINDDKLKAEESARQDALRQAVEQVAGVMISSNSTALSNQIVRDQIFSQSVGYVKSYDVLSKKEEGKVMSVTVKATISQGKLDQDLQAVKGLIQRLSNKRVVIALQEQTNEIGGKIISTENLATKLTERFKSDGWTILDEKGGSDGKIKINSAITGADQDISKLVDTADVDYIIYGSVAFQQQDPGVFLKEPKGQAQSYFPVTGQWNMTVYSKASRSQLVKINGKVGMSDIKGKPGTSPLIDYQRTAYDIIRVKGPEIVDEVRAAIVEELRKEETDGRRVVLKVSNVPDFSALDEIARALNEGVKGLKVDGDPTLNNGKADFELRFLGTTSELARSINNKTIKGRKMQVTGRTGDTIEVTLAK